MYVGKQYDAKHTETFLIEFNCPLCSFSCDAETVGTGYGSAQSPFFMNNAGAEDDAREGAWASAAKNARYLVRLARCPKCGRRSFGRIIRFIMISLLWMLLVSVPFVALGAWFWGRREQGYGALFIGVGLVLAGAVYFTVVHPKWAGVSRRLRFVKPEPSNDQPD
jgi:hypothetical protein